MHEPRHVRIHYCTGEVRSLMAELPLDGLLQQGARILTADEFAYLQRQLTLGRRARIDGPDCWFEYEIVGSEAA